MAWCSHGNLVCRFNLVGAKDTGAVHNPLGSVSNNLPRFISTDFRRDYFIGFSELKKYKVAGGRAPICEVFSSSIQRKPISSLRRVLAVATAENFAPPVNIPSESVKAWSKEFQWAINSLFSENYLRLLEQYRNRLGDYLGIHYRGGDVVYGSARHSVWAVLGKSAPLALVEDVIRNEHEREILVFGTPIDDTLDDLIFLRDKYRRVHLSDEFAVKGLDAVVLDSMMMSSCSALVSYRGTGVARLANLINPDLELISFNVLYPERQYFELCMNSLDQPEYNPLQRSYLRVRALALCEALRVDEETRRELEAGIRELDPRNKLHWLGQRERIERLSAAGF